MPSLLDACALQSEAFREGNPGWIALINEESQGSLEMFAMMCDLGLLTTDSQEGVDEHTEKAPRDMALWGATSSKFDTIERIRKQYERLGGTYGEALMREKAYVKGFMRLDHAKAATACFNEKTDKTAWIVAVDEHESRVPVTFYEFDDGCYSDLTMLSTATRRMTLLSDMFTQGITEDHHLLACVTFLDPKAGRAARNPKEGLYGDVIMALEVAEVANLK